MSLWAMLDPFLVEMSEIGILKSDWRTEPTDFGKFPNFSSEFRTDFFPQISPFSEPIRNETFFRKRLEWQLKRKKT